MIRSHLGAFFLGWSRAFYYHKRFYPTTGIEWRYEYVNHKAWLEGVPFRQREVARR